MTTNEQVIPRKRTNSRPIDALKRPYNISQCNVEKSIIERCNLEEASGGRHWSFLIQRLRHGADSRSLSPTAGRGATAKSAWNASRSTDAALSSACRVAVDSGEGRHPPVSPDFFNPAKYSNGTCSVTRHQHCGGSAGAYLIGCLQVESLGAYGSHYQSRCTSGISALPTRAFFEETSARETKQKCFKCRNIYSKTEMRSRREEEGGWVVRGGWAPWNASKSHLKKNKVAGKTFN